MKIPFNIKFRPQIESGEYKVETRDGRPARIICYNRKFGNQLVALSTEKDGRESYISCNSDGRVNTIYECTSDLIIIAPEPELSEDEKNWIAALEYIKDDALRSWLEKQKDKVVDHDREQNEDEKIRKEIISAILSGRVYDTDLVGADEHIFELDKEVADKWLAYLEKQKEQKPAEWSEEDKKMLDNTLDSLRRYQLSMPNFQVELQMRWLKSLRPRPHWKPSKEQIDALDNIASAFSQKNKEYKTVMKYVSTLRDELKKL